MSKDKALLVFAGMVLGALLTRPAVVDAANTLMFGSVSGAAKAVAVTSAGAVIVTLN